MVEALGRKEIQKALGTADRRVANLALPAADMAINEMFEEARARLAREQVRSGPMASWEGYAEQVQIDEDREKELRENADFHAWQDARRAMLGDVIEQKIREMFQSLAIVAPVQTASPAPLPQSSQRAPLQRSPGHDLDAMYDLWHKAAKPQPRTAEQYKLALDRFARWTGVETVEAATKADVVKYREALAANCTASVTSLSLRQVSAMFNKAVSNAWIEANPAKGVKPEVSRQRAKSLRPPFDVRTLNNVFSSRVYALNERPAKGGGEASYWIPLLLLLTGARIEEVAQLAPDDVYEETYLDAAEVERRVWVVRFVTNDERGQRVKNFSSHRRVPLHRELVTRGFQEFAQAQLQAGKSRIFDQLTADHYGRESGGWSEWWIDEYLRKECDPTSPKMVLHSFRHTFKDACRDCGIIKETMDAIQGHSDGDASDDYGAEFYPLRPLVDALEKYKVSGVSLPAPPPLQ
ncbi:hypothetical protein C5615_35805 [Burkholderia cepacia]|uniref:Integrase SAM-like N-terminal domain-containing protein n=1 Tax=Burkholderia cepacia TaxID=292 RepID=A0A2S8I235_BURCE|nr:hypothetical protein C5615_35805 [Burkholderia cepacia]